MAAVVWLVTCCSLLSLANHLSHSWNGIAVWLLGNLARATYVGSSDFMWPFSYNGCDTKGRLSQEINACDKVNHYGMASEIGRGSPEIDILESMQGNMDEKLPSTHIKRPYQSTSLQVRCFAAPCSFVANYLRGASGTYCTLPLDWVWKLTPFLYPFSV